MWVMKDFTIHVVIKPENWIFVSKYPQAFLYLKHKLILCLFLMLEHKIWAVNHFYIKHTAWNRVGDQ